MEETNPINNIKKFLDNSSYIIYIVMLALLGIRYSINMYEGTMIYEQMYKTMDKAFDLAIFRLLIMNFILMVLLTILKPIKSIKLIKKDKEEEKNEEV